ncbi:2973_t:CDS:1, partial [Gigaspora margarita]
RMAKDIVLEKTDEISLRQVTLLYADNTTWIAKSREDLISIISTVNKFYEINDIKINEKKLELLVINRKRTELNIEVGKNKSIVQAKNMDQAIRFLEV